MYPLKLYYNLKPYIPRKIQIFIRREFAKILKRRNRLNWPIPRQAFKTPEYWSGWAADKQFALILTHDVDTQKGFDNCQKLLEIDNQEGFKSAFYFVPERYKINFEKLSHIKDMGFEVGVHGLNHDGRLLESKEIFLQRAKRINEYIDKWDAVGFRAPSMHHDLELFKHLNIEYDASTFDSDPFEPQFDGMNTIFPFPVLDDSKKICYWELPYTLSQDSTVFLILQEKNNDIWRKKLDWIAQKGGMALLNTHPDYINFNGGSLGNEEYPQKNYRDFLLYIKNKYDGKYWNPLPKELVNFLNKKYK